MTYASQIEGKERSMPALVDQLRNALVPVLTVGTWEDIKCDHQQVQLGWRPELDPGWGKHKYVHRVLAELSADELEDLAKRCLESFPERCTDVQDALWWIEAKGTTEISELTRRALANAFDGHRLHPELDPNEAMELFSQPVNHAVSRYEYLLTRCCRYFALHETNVGIGHCGCN